MTEGDWVHQALKQFITEFKQTRPTNYEHAKILASDIVQWCEGNDTFSKNPILTNALKLGRYIRSHTAVLDEALGLYENGTKANRITYGLRKR
jgi:hypothetical protein